jgi:TonB family protein
MVSMWNCRSRPTRGSTDMFAARYYCEHSEKYAGKLLCPLLIICSLGLTLPPASRAQTENTKDRKLVTRVEPQYPETLKRLYIGGVVRLELAISPRGTVENATLLGGNPILGQSAIMAVKKWRYMAANSRTSMQVTLEFDPHP